MTVKKIIAWIEMFEFDQNTQSIVKVPIVFYGV